MNRFYLRCFIVLFLGFTSASCGSSGTQAEKTAVADPLTIRETIYGTTIGKKGMYDSYAWLGLPYAIPPAGKLRWRAPQNPDAWQQPREALAFENHCPQLANRNGGVSHLKTGTPTGSEDCLYLNIWTPPFAPDKIPEDKKRLPVMVWIHGGSNVMGHGGLYNGGHLATRHNLVVLTLNYRLGPLGWFAHPALRAETANRLNQSGNFATLDLIKALEWVRDNINSFGGDPSNVTIFGESAGAYNVYTLLVSPLARGLFHKAIVQSGGSAFASLSEAERYDPDRYNLAKLSSNETIASLLITDQKAADIPSALKLINTMSQEGLRSYLRAIKPFTLLNALRKKDPAGNLHTRIQVYSNLRDGYIIPDKDPADLLLDKKSYNPVPTIFGTNRDEQKLFLAFDPDYVKSYFGAIFRIKDKNRYERDVAYLTNAWKLRGVDRAATSIKQSQGSDVFAYRFDWDEEPNLIVSDFSEILGAAHGFEIPFVFGNFDLGSFLANLMISSNDEGRIELSSAMMSYWAEFAYNGDPGTGREGQFPHWKSWNNGKGQDKMILFDTAEGGGIRMSPDNVTFNKLVSQLEMDNSFKTQREKCEMFVRMFHGRFEWDQETYFKLAGKGCRGYPPSRFAR